MPLQTLSTVPVIGKYLTPDNSDILPLVDYELGGVGIQDPSKGSRFQVWKLEYVSGHVLLSAPNTARILLFDRPKITDLTLAFDQNMHPFVAFTNDDQSTFWWYDTVSNSQIFTDLPSGCMYPKACTDDKRSTQTASSDIILAYIRAGTLYFRAQRDRYLIEYPLASGLTARLNKIGMTSQNRVQFKLIPIVQ